MNKFCAPCVRGILGVSARSLTWSVPWYVCIYVCIYIYIHIHLRASLWGGILCASRVRGIHALMPGLVARRTRPRPSISPLAFLYIHMLHVHTHTHTQSHIHTDIYIYIHTYIPGLEERPTRARPSISLPALLCPTTTTLALSSVDLTVTLATTRSSMPRCGNVPFYAYVCIYIYIIYNVWKCTFLRVCACIFALPRSQHPHSCMWI
jgi:hypothetical protein